MNYKYFFINVGTIVGNLQHLPQQVFQFIALLLLVLLVFILYKRISRLINLNTRKIQHEIRDSVQARFIELSDSANSFVDIASEAWRLKQKINKLNSSISENQYKSLELSLEKMVRSLEKHDVEVKDYTGRAYNSGLTSIDVISVEKDKNAKGDVIKEMMEPAIFVRGMLVKKGKVIVLTNKK